MVKDLDESQKIGLAFKGNNNQRPQLSFKRDNTFHPYQRYQPASQQRSQNNFYGRAHLNLPPGGKIKISTSVATLKQNHTSNQQQSQTMMNELEKNICKSKLLKTDLSKLT